MIKTYINDLINKFDQEFASLVIPFPDGNIIVKPSIVETYDVATETVDTGNDNQDLALPTVTPEDNSQMRLAKIEALATEISAERYRPNYNPEICLANLLNSILSNDIGSPDHDDFFQLLNQERGVDLNEALNDFDFYLDNPYKKKAEKILSKIEARKNK